MSLELGTESYLRRSDVWPKDHLLDELNRWMVRTTSGLRIHSLALCNWVRILRKLGAFGETASALAR